MKKKVVVKEVVDMMSNIDSFSQTIKGISEKIKISLIPIQTLANQIQLWSNNAVIEISKLGDQGKVFNTIVEEIKGLSEKLLYISNETSSNLADNFFKFGNFDPNLDKKVVNSEDVKNYFSEIENAVEVLKNNISSLYQKFESIKNEALEIVSSKDIKNIEISLSNLAALAEEDLSNIHDLNKASLDVQRAIENLAEISKETVYSTNNISEKAVQQLKEAGKLDEISNDIKIKSNELEDEIRKFKI